MSSQMVSTRAKITEMSRMAKETEDERAAKQQIRQEARMIRSKEIERQMKEEDDDESSSSQLDGRRRGSTASPTRFSSRKSSVEPSITLPVNSFDTRTYRFQLHDLEQKFKGVMLVNAQLDNEKQLLRYNVDLLKDKLEDMSELNTLLQKSNIEKKRELAYQRMQLTELGHQLCIAQKQIVAHDALLTQRDLVIISTQDMPDSTIAPVSSAGALTEAGIHNGDIALTQFISSRLNNGRGSSSHLTDSSHDSGSASVGNGLALVSKQTAELMQTIPGMTIEAKFCHMLEDQDRLNEKVNRLQELLDEERQRSEVVQKLDAKAAFKGQDPEDLRHGIQTARSQAQEYKFKLEQANQRIASLEGDIIRFEGQVKRYKIIAETCEQQEDQLKQDRRKFQRELRETNMKVEDLKSENASLQRRLDKYLRVGPSLPTLGGSSLRNFRESSQSR